MLNKFVKLVLVFVFAHLVVSLVIYLHAHATAAATPILFPCLPCGRFVMLLLWSPLLMNHGPALTNAPPHCLLKACPTIKDDNAVKASPF